MSPNTLCGRHSSTQGHARGYATMPGIYGSIPSSSSAAWLRAGWPVCWKIREKRDENELLGIEEMRSRGQWIEGKGTGCLSCLSKSWNTLRPHCWNTVNPLRANVPVWRRWFWRKPLRRSGPLDRDGRTPLPPLRPMPDAAPYSPGSR